MPAPRMVIVGGPSGGGKSSQFSSRKIVGVTSFSTGVYCAALNAQRLGRQNPVYVGITPGIRSRGGFELKDFIDRNIAARQSFAFETTLHDITFEQARRANANGAT